MGVTIETQIKGMKLLVKQLKKIRVSATELYNGEWQIKWGKKLNMMKVPSQEWASRISESFNAIISTYREDCETILRLLEQRCEQLTLSLFKEKDEELNGK